MSNGGSILDSIRGLFSSSSGDGGSREARGREGDPVRERMERVEQIHSGVEMASSALADDLKQLRRESREAASAVLETARSRVPDEGDGRDGSAGSREILEDLSRCVDALEELHYRLLQVEVHPEVESDEEREQAADRARDAVQRAREVADSLTGATAARDDSTR